MVIRISLTIFLLAAVSLSAAEPEQKEGLEFVDTGPIRFREQFLIGMGYFAFDPASAEVLGRGALRVDVVQSVTNTFARSDSVTLLLEARGERRGVDLTDLRGLEPDRAGSGVYFTDGEVTRTSVALRRGIGHGLEVSVTAPLLRFDGGSLDGIVEDFHHTFGLSQGGRTGAPRDRYTVYLRDAAGREVFRKVASGTRLGDVALGVKLKLPIGSDHWNMAVENAVELPTGNEKDLYSTGGVDFGTQLLVTRYFARSCIHGSVGVVYAAQSEVFGTKAQMLGSLMIGYEQAIGGRSSAVAQLTASQSPFRSLGIEELSANAYLVDIGLKHAVTPHTVAFVAVSENLVSYGSSADIGLHVGFTWTK